MTVSRLAVAGLAAIALVGLGADAGEMHWTPFYMVPAGMILVDQGSVAADRDRVGLTYELWFEHTKASPTGKVDFMRSEVRLDCPSRGVTILNERYYDAGGRLVAADLKRKPGLSPRRGTFESALLTRYCPKPSPTIEPDQSRRTAGG